MLKVKPKAAPTIKLKTLLVKKGKTGIKKLNNRIRMKTAEIKITVSLDDKNLPESILWYSSDSENTQELPCKSMILALWDQQYQNSLRLDLWTKDMPVDEMKRFFYETLMTMSDSFLKATGETNIVEDLRDYCAHFAEKMELNANSQK